MNRNIILGFAGGLVFAISLLIGLVVADNATDQGGGEPRLPGALGDPIEIIPGSPISDPDAPVEFDQPIEPTQAAYVPIDTGSSAGGAGGSSSPGGGGVPAGGGEDEGPGEGDTTELTVGPLAPVEIEAPRTDGIFDPSLELLPDLYFELFGFPPFRFLDLCADSPLPGCPPGVGGTVLFPLGGGLDTLGDFRLGTRLVNAPEGTDCSFYVDARSRDIQHPLYLWASHPAHFDIRVRAAGTDRESPLNIVAIGNDAIDHPEFIRFADDAVEGRLATSSWPRDCFVLIERPDLAGTSYLIEVNATSFTGQTDSRTYTYEVPAGSRQPVWFEPRNDHDVRVWVPVKSETSQRAWVAAIHESSDMTCAGLPDPTREVFDTIEAGSSVVTGTTQPLLWGFSLPTMGYDPAYNAVDVIEVLGLREGSAYQVCIWWVEQATTFAERAVLEREVHFITTPNRLTPVIRLRSIENNSGRDLGADEYLLTSTCPGARTARFPSEPLSAGRARSIPQDLRPVICRYDGRSMPSAVRFAASNETYDKGFAIALTGTGRPRIEQVTVDVSADGPEPGTGVGVLSDGTLRGPRITFDVAYLEGLRGGGDEWGFGSPEALFPGEIPDEELPEEIEIDRITTDVLPDGRDGIRVTALFDRPVRLSASLLGADVCLTGTRTAFFSAILSDTYSFRIGGLCADTRYSVLLEATDEDGNTTSFADTTLPPHPDAVYAPLSGFSDGYHVTYTMSAQARPIHVAHSLVYLSVTIDGVSTPFGTPDDCFPNHDSPRTQTGVWGEEVRVTVNMLAVGEGGDRESLGFCPPAPPGPDRIEWRGSFSTTMATEALTTIEMRIPLVAEEERGRRIGFAFEIDLAAEITG